MSSHREAPEISKDPVADNTDVYAFVSPDRPDTVTLIANFIPLQGPAAGPNFFEFGDDVLYTINVDLTGDGKPDLAYEFRFETKVRNSGTFLYNTGPIQSLDSENWNRRQFYTVTRVDNRGRRETLGRDLACPPCNIGPLSTPDYPSLGEAAIHDIGGGRKVFAGQRADAFYVDLGSVFDLLDLRPFQQLHEQYGLSVFSAPADGVNTLRFLNVHTIAIQVPMDKITRGRKMPTNPMSRDSVIGVWATASRRKVTIRGESKGNVQTGPFVQVSRLGNPLVNEVLIPMGLKDGWNASKPDGDAAFVKYVSKPEVSGLIPLLYPGVFDNLAALNASGAARADLVAILMTGLPSGIVPGFQNFTGPKPSDMLRLNLAVPPTEKPNILGLIGGDAAGFPNGRRIFDDVVTIELRALAGITYPLIDPTFTPDGAAGLVTDGTAPGSGGYLDSFPYLGNPYSGYDVPSS